MYAQFRFRDSTNAMMTMFYIMNGDTMFDTITGIRQVSPALTFIWSYLWIWFGNNVIVNITLAMVEDGYLEQKNHGKDDWLIKNTVDPADDKH